MDNIKKRFLLFLFGCIGVRLFLVYLAKTQLGILRYLGYLAILPAIGFLLIFLFGLRKTGQEVFGEKIWWNPLRPVHAFLWGLFAYLAIKGEKYAWKVLLVDVLIGLFSFLIYHWMVGDFKRIR
jgi:hypothetical protein